MLFVLKNDFRIQIAFEKIDWRFDTVDVPYSTDENWFC